MDFYNISFRYIFLVLVFCISIGVCQANSDIATNQPQDEGLSANPWKKRNKVKKRKKLLYNEHVQKYDANARDIQIEQIQAQTQAILQRNAEAQEEIIRQKEAEKQNTKKNNDNHSEGFDVLDLIIPETKNIEQSENQTQTKKQNNNTENQPTMLDDVMDEYNKATKKFSKMKRKATNYYNKVRGYTQKSIRNLNKMLK